MIIHTLKLTNYRFHADTTIDFDTGITGIVGTNGEGKSTLIEAISWMLFGNSATEGRADGIRWKRAPARHVAEGEMEFTVGGSRYHVWRSETDAILKQDGVKIAQKRSGVDPKMASVLGMDLAQFEATYLCRQKELSRISDMKGQERRTFFLNVMGIGRIVDAQKSLRESKSTLASRVEGLRLGLGDRELLDTEFAAASAELKRAVTALPDLCAAEKAAAVELAAAEEAAAASGTLATRHAEATDARTRAIVDQNREEVEIGRINERIATAVSAESRVQAANERLAELPDLRSRLTGLREAGARASARQSLVEVIAQTEAQIAEDEEVIADARHQIDLYSVERHFAVREQLKDATERLRALTADRERRLAEAKARAEALQREITRNGRKVEAIQSSGNDGACPTCTRPLGEHYESVLENLRRELDELRSELTDCQASIEQHATPSDEELEISAECDSLTLEGSDLQQKHQDADRAADAIRRRTESKTVATTRLESQRSRLAEMPEAAESDPGVISELAAKVAELEKLEADADLVEARRISGQLPELRADLTRHEATLEDAKARIRKADESMAELIEFDADQHQRNVEAVGVVRTRHTEARLALTRGEDLRKTAEERVERAVASIDAHEEKERLLAAATADLEAHREADTRMSEFRVEQASTIRPEMEELTSAMVSMLTDGRFESCTIDQDFEVTLQRGGVDYPEISGGEKDIVALAQRIAASQMISERAGHPLSLLILDEPFGHQDRVRTQNIIGLIRRLKDVFAQVLVISHLEEVKDAADHSLHVELDQAELRSRVTVLTAAPAAAA